ncbi:hypothetical protein HJG60_011103 [Phyllostomus discolor]|uniref:Uncharacterized protein n=1 Tax=Phyllostomus discolor TaxID=89673 RepID=A0A834A3V1_9CHIR|nr:hypothetical protein HJG60_011103 [Phyllostomus discolor]
MGPGVPGGKGSGNCSRPGTPKPTAALGSTPRCLCYRNGPPPSTRSATATGVHAKPDHYGRRGLSSDQLQTQPVGRGPGAAHRASEAPAGVAQLVGTSPCKLKGRGCDSPSGHRPGVRAQSPVGARTRGNPPMFPPLIDVSLPPFPSL